MNFFSVFSFINAILNIFLGALVLFKNHQKAQKIYFFLFTAAIFLWNIGYGIMYGASSTDQALFFAKLGTIGIILIPYFANLFVVETINKKERLLHTIITLYAAFLLYFLYIGCFYKSAVLHSWGFYPTANTLNFLNILFFVAVFSKINYQLFKQIRKTESPMNMHYKYLFMAFFIGWFGFIDWIPNYVKSLPLAGVLSFTWVIIIAYAISKHKLFNIRVVITKTTSYLILIPIIAASVVLIFTLQCSLTIKIILTSLMAIFWAFCGYKILELVQSPLNRAILKQTYHIETLIQNLSKALASILDADEAVKETLSLLKHCLHFSYAHVFMFSASTNLLEYRTLAAHSSSSLALTAQSNIVRFFNENQNAIAFKDLPSDIKSEFDRSLKDPKAILFPIYSLQTLYGLMIFGPKTTQLPYTEHDTALFVSLLNMLRFVFKRIDFHEQLRSKSSNLESQVEEAVLVQQKMACELEQKQKMESELKIASDIQKRLLPHTPPAIANFRIESAFFPARIVSGDYYQFYPFSENEIGIVIADIVGKGIPASYSMFVVHALISKYIDGQLSPKEMLNRLNQLFYNEHALSKYVPLTYAKLNTQTRVLTYSNAGHQPPLFISGSVIQELAVRDIPLAMEADTEYQEESIQLQNHDQVLFFTDGLTEAKNKIGDFYGSDRLLSICKKHFKTTGNYSQLTAAIVSDWRSFSENVNQQADDFTLIALDCAPLRVFK